MVFNISLCKLPTPHKSLLITLIQRSNTYNNIVSVLCVFDVRKGSRSPTVHAQGSPHSILTDVINVMRKIDTDLDSRFVQNLPK